MKAARLLRFFPLLLLLLGMAVAAVTPAWYGNVTLYPGRPKDAIFTNNLYDIVFNPEGEILGWYVKAPAGSSSISVKNGKVDAQGVLGEKNNLLAGQRALVIPLHGKPVAQPPALTHPAPNRFQAVFRYRQGAVSVVKTIVLNPVRFTISVTTQVTGAPAYQLDFTGMDNPQLKGLSVGSSSVVNSGKVPSLRYASLQAGGADALIVEPVQGTAATARLIPGTHGKIALSLAGTSRLRVYGGPNELIHLYLEHYSNLPGLFQANIFGQLSLLLVILLQLINSVVGSWGVSILILTLIIRILTWPLMQAQLRSFAEMQVIQPMIKEVNAKFKDPAKRNEATMALYKEHGVNPAAGCLPVIVQLPILLILWRVFANFEFTAPFLWLPDLSIPDPYYILPALYLLSNVAQMYFSTRKAPEMFRQQLIIQVVYIFIALSFPAGVVIYWVFSTLLGIGQQIWINRQIEQRMQRRAAAKSG
jgi:YidC/Oxa1 family membrane protein insertase